MQLKAKLIFGGVSVSLVMFVVCAILVFSHHDNYKGCSVGEYLCQNTSICIKQALSCNTVFDCPLHDDEKDCYNIPLRFKNVITSMNNLGKYNNSTSYVNESLCYLSNIPDNCSCQLDVLYCINISFIDIIPQNVEGPLRKLYLVNNNMEILNEDSFVEYPSLNVVSIQSMPITKVKPGAFRGLENLNRLFFSETNLRIIEPGFFVGLNTLTFLVMDHNQIIDFDMLQLENMTELIHLHLESNKLTLKETKFPPLFNLTYITFKNNRIKLIGPDLFSQLSNLENLDLGDNLIEYIHPNAFRKLTKLLYLILHNNQIKNLDNSVFYSQISLNDLDLSGNPLVNFNQILLSKQTSLSKLNVKGITILNISVGMFEHMKILKETYFKKYSYCRYVPHIRNCHPHTDGISNNENLLANVSQRVCVWIMITISYFGNLIVVYYRLPLLKKNLEAQRKSEHFFLISLATADFLMAIYLTIIAMHDQMFRGKYIRYSNSFLASPVCMTAGIIGTVSSEVSLLTLTAMTIERWSTIANISSLPLGLKSMMKFFLAIWVAAVVIAVAPIFVWSERNQFYGSNGVCFPLNTNQFTAGWQYSVFMMSLNLLCICTIITCYTRIIVQVRSNQKARDQEVTSNGPWRRNAIEVHKMSAKIFAIVLTDCLCWLPIIATVFIGIAGDEIPLSVNSWIIVFVLPINSAINPIIYTFNTRIFINSFKKWKHQVIASVDKFSAKNNLFAVELNERRNQSDISDRRNPSDISDRQHAKSTEVHDEDVTQDTKLSTISPVSDSHFDPPAPPGLTYLGLHSIMSD